MAATINGYNGYQFRRARRSAGAAGLARAVGAALLRPLEIAMQWQDRARERRQLLQMSDRLLKDIGISRVDAVHEADKPFWRR